MGVYAGTFDPVHPGHVAFCRQALATCELDEIVIVPERYPRGKGQVTDLAHRMALLQQAVAPLPELRVVMLESARFTVQHTLPELQRLLGDAELTLLIGSDVVPAMLDHWPDVGRLLQAMPLAVGLRGEDSFTKIVCLLGKVGEAAGVTPRYTLIATEHADLASSRIRSGERIAGFTPGMLAYIRRHGLYPQAAG